MLLLFFGGATATVSADGTAAGSGAAAAVSKVIQSSICAAAGLGAAAATSKATVQAAGAATGVGAATGTSASVSVTTATSTAAGSGAAAAVGEASSPGVAENVLANEVVSSSNVWDSALASPPVLVSDLDESPDSPDSSWWRSSAAADAEVLLGFATPTGTPTGTQTFRANVKRRIAGTPDYLTLSLYESGTLIRGLGTTAITSDIGQVVTGSWLASEVASKANVQVKIKISSAP
jgi:hypothetical protein